MLEILRTIDGLTALTLNDKVVLTMESRGHDTTELEQVAQRLGKILAIELYESQVQKNPGEFWEEVIIRRQADRAHEVVDAERELNATGVAIHRSDIAGYYFDVANAIDAPDMDGLGGTASNDYETRDEAVLAAFKHINVHRNNKLEESESESPTP